MISNLYIFLTTKGPTATSSYNSTLQGFHVVSEQRCLFQRRKVRRACDDGIGMIGFTLGSPHKWHKPTTSWCSQVRFKLQSCVYRLGSPQIGDQRTLKCGVVWISFWRMGCCGLGPREGSVKRERCGEVIHIHSVFAIGLSCASQLM